MRGIIGLATVALLAVLLADDRSFGQLGKMASVQRDLAGQLIDNTARHGRKQRIWSSVLGEYRDLYVYLPPGYDPHERYPVMIWLHGFFQDERTFIYENSLRDYDAAIRAGRLPPLIIAIPDGSLKGRPTLFRGNPLWINSPAGNFEDYVVQDIWGILQQKYSLRPERGAHVLAGYSGGGAAAYRLGIKHRDTFGVVMGTHPPLNLRWQDCHGRYFAPFDPNCWGWREDVDRGREPLARFYGVVVIRVRHLVYPIFGRGPESIAKISAENPIEMIDAYDLRPKELAMYVGYAGRDQFNVTAQVDSFLYRAKERGLTVSYGFDPRGRHDWKSADLLRPGMTTWLAEQLAPYSPVGCCR